MPIKLQYASNLHLEFPDNKEYLKQHFLQSVGSVLVLSRDIVRFMVMGKHQDFFSYVADNFKTTYWLPGNREYYHFDVVEKTGMLHESIRSNVFLVSNMIGLAKLITNQLGYVQRNENQFFETNKKIEM